MVAYVILLWLKSEFGDGRGLLECGGAEVRD